MAGFSPDTLRKILQDTADKAFPDTVRQFWDPVVEGYDVRVGNPARGRDCITYNLTVGPGRVYLAPRAGAPC